MKRLLLTSASLLALMAAASATSAKTFEFPFSFTGAIVDFVIPMTGTYEILAFGAQGGDGSTDNDDRRCRRQGRQIQGDFQLTAGDQLEIVVGGAGQSSSYYGGGGGGGSFVIGPHGKLLLVAGGGGGAGGGVGPRGSIPTPRGHSRLRTAPAGRKARMAVTAPAAHSWRRIWRKRGQRRERRHPLCLHRRRRRRGRLQWQRQRRRRRVWGTRRQGRPRRVQGGRRRLPKQHRRIWRRRRRRRQQRQARLSGHGRGRGRRLQRGRRRWGRILRKHARPRCSWRRRRGRRVVRRRRESLLVGDSELAMATWDQSPPWIIIGAVPSPRPG